MEDFKIDAQRIIDIMSEEVTGYVSKLSIAKAQIESLAKVIDAQNKEIEQLKSKLTPAVGGGECEDTNSKKTRKA